MVARRCRWCSGGCAEALQPRLRRTRSDEGFKWLYFDTIVYDAATLRFVCEQAGVDKVLMGTDLPFTIADRSR